jgi:hypothetical protein
MDYNQTHPCKKHIRPTITSNNIKESSKDSTMTSDIDELIQSSSSSLTNVNILPSTPKSRQYKVKDIENWIALPPEVE